MKMRIRIGKNPSHAVHLCKEITMFGLDCGDHYEYYHRKDYMAVSPTKMDKTYYSILKKNIDKICVIQTNNLNMFCYKNGILHSLVGYAYQSHSYLAYYIDGQHLNEQEWINHPKVIAHKRKAKMKEIFG